MKRSEVARAKSQSLPNAATRKRMKAVKRRNTEPEILVKKAFRKAGLRFRSGQGRHKPNSADVLLPQQRCAIFVNGCFWHGHKGCKRATIPATRKSYWLDKIRKNVARDERAMKAFFLRGWLPLMVWECEAREPETLTRIANKLRERAEVYET